MVEIKPKQSNLAHKTSTIDAEIRFSQSFHINKYETKCVGFFNFI